jgi:TolA-binding protein
MLILQIKSNQIKSNQIKSLHMSFNNNDQDTKRERERERERERRQEEVEQSGNAECHHPHKVSGLKDYKTHHAAHPKAQIIVQTLT